MPSLSSTDSISWKTPLYDRRNERFGEVQPESVGCCFGQVPIVNDELVSRDMRCTGGDQSFMETESRTGRRLS